MSLTIDSKINLLNDHYKDTFSYLREYIKQRDRLIIYVVIILGFHFFSISFPEDSNEFIQEVIKSKAGLSMRIAPEILTNLIWFLLMLTVLKYYQATTLIEKQYRYIHSLEDEFEVLYGKSLIHREGYSYLKNYPLISSFAHIIYVWIFPIFLITISLFKIVSDFDGVWCELHFIINILLLLGICISTIFYIIFQKFKH